MYQEICKKSKITLMKMILLVLSFYMVILMIKYAFSLSVISSTIIDLGIIIIIAVGIYLIVIKNMIYYKYSIIGEEFIVTKILGITEKVQVNMHKEQIVEIIEKNLFNDNIKKNEYVSRLKLHSKTPEKIYYLIYLDNGKKSIIEIQASDELLEHMKKD